MRQFLFVCAALAMMTGGCTNASDVNTGTIGSEPLMQEPKHGLAGTMWRLVYFQSADDNSRIVPPNVENYTLQFMPDGILAMQLDCNRGSATWKVADVTATSATLTVSPVALTRAMCEPGAIDTRLARDLEFVRGFTMVGGKMRMALNAGDGYYVWEPAPSSS